MADLQEHEIETGLVPSPRRYKTLLPDGPAENLPLMLLLHGGSGSSDFLGEVQPLIEHAWTSGSLPHLAVATLDAERSFYLDFEDGSQRWETFMLTEWLPALQKQLPVSASSDKTLIAGISMGGYGATRIGFRHPGLFAAVAAMEPAVMPALKFEDVRADNIAFQPQEILEERFGSPVDEHWNLNNPSRIAIENADEIKAAGTHIYLEVGTEDFFKLNEGTEFLHQTLLQQGIDHEYRVVLGANHVDATIAPRFLDLLGFMGRALAPRP